MTLAKYLMAFGAMSLATTPVLAAPVNAASSLSIAKSVRAGTSAKADKSKAVGGGVIVAVLAAAAVVAGIVIVASDDDDDSN